MNPVLSVVAAFGVMGAIGVVFGALLSFASNKFHVEVDERVQKVRAALPGANCGACGYVGCDSYAEAVVEQGAAPNLCAPGGASTATAVGDAMGVSVEAQEAMVARVLCQGTEGIAKERYEYDGLQSCRVAASLAAGPNRYKQKCPAIRIAAIIESSARTGLK